MKTTKMTKDVDEDDNINQLFAYQFALICRGGGGLTIHI